MLIDLQTILIVSLSGSFIFIKFPAKAARYLLLLKMRTFHMSSAVTPVTELLPTRLTLKLFLGWKHSAVNNLFHQISKYIYKHRHTWERTASLLYWGLPRSYGVNKAWASIEDCLDRWLLTWRRQLLLSLNSLLHIRQRYFSSSGLRGFSRKTSTSCPASTKSQVKTRHFSIYNEVQHSQIWLIRV